MLPARILAWYPKAALGSGVSFHRRQGSLNWKVALTFGGAGMLVAYLAAWISKKLPGSVL